MEQDLRLDAASEHDQVAGSRGGAESDVFPGSCVQDDTMASQRKTDECQRLAGISVGNRPDNVELYGASETVRPLTAPVALMFTAPLLVPEPSKNGDVPRLRTFTPTPMTAAVAMPQLWEDNSAVDDQAIASSQSRFQAIYDLPVTPDRGSPEEAAHPSSDPVSDSDAKHAVKRTAPSSNAAETVKTNERVASTSEVIQPSQILQPAQCPGTRKVANTSKARGTKTFKRKRPDTPTAAKTPASKTFASAAVVDSPRPPPVFQDESGVYYIAEKLIDWRSSKARNGKMIVQVLVFWEGYPREEATWEPMNSIRQDVGEARWHELADALWLCPGDDVEVTRKELLAYHRFRREQRKREYMVVDDEEDDDDATGNPFVDGDVDFF